MTDQYPSRSADKIVVRLPDGMRDRLAEVAKSNNRSVNAEVVARLTLTFEAGYTDDVSENKRKISDLENAVKILQDVTSEFGDFVKGTTRKG